MDIISLDINYINKLKLNINEYLTLLKIYRLEGKDKIPFIVSDDDIKSLIIKKYLTEDKNNDSSLNFTIKATNLFNSTDEVFIKFYDTFPHKIPDGKGSYRPVSTVDSNSMSAKGTRKLWDKLTNGNTTLQLTIISRLETELKVRKNTSTLIYLNNIDTWLRQYTWEKWENYENVSDTSLRGDSNEKML